jgi:hypothetical protein
MAGETPEIDETKELATVGMAMGIGILTRLEAKGLLAAHDVDEVLEGILNSLKTSYLPLIRVRDQLARSLMQLRGLWPSGARNPHHLAKNRRSMFRHRPPSQGAQDAP